MTRLARLPENQLPTELQYIRSSLDDIKNRQFTGGANLLTYFNPGEDIVKSNIGPFDEHRWRVVFQPNSGVRTYNSFDVVTVTTNATGFERITAGEDPTYAGSTSDSAWIIYLYNDSNTIDVTFVMGYRALEEGTVTWEEI